MIQSREVVLGRGDYVAGGAFTEPFLSQDGARRRRPMILGEIDESRIDPVLDGMFSGRTSDLYEWANMWKELGVDGVCIRVDGSDPAAIRYIIEKIPLPFMLDGSTDAVKGIAEQISGSVLVTAGAVAGDHVPAFEEPADTEQRGMFLVRVRYPDREGYDQLSRYRISALKGCGPNAPMIADVTSVWSDGFADPRSASMMEAEASLVAMLSGADMIIIKGPGAADMARTYGEELADL